MSQEQIVIAGVVALNLVLLMLLITAYRLLAGRAPTQQTHEDLSSEGDEMGGSAEQMGGRAAEMAGRAEEIRGLEALFAHDSWPGDRFSRGDQFSARAVDGFKE